MATVASEFAADMPAIRQVPFDAPWAWLGAGWRDLTRVPALSLSYGLVFALAALAIAVALLQFGWLSLILPLAGGFLLIGPLLAVGLYEASRRIEAGEPVQAADIALVGVRSPGQLAFMGVMLLVLYFAWVEIALLQFMLFFGPGDLPPMESFVPAMLFTVQGVSLLVVGSLTGGVLALVVYAMTAVAIPLLMVRKIDVVTAALTSVQAVMRNPKPMLLWAVLIAAAMAIGLATLFVGLIVAFPLVGHATWHAFRDVVALSPAEVDPEAA